MGKKIYVLLMVLLLAAGCRLVPSTGDTTSDAAAAQNFVPVTIPGYNSTEASSITDALSKLGIGVSTVTGNLALTGAIAKLDDMIRCYQGVGAVAARIYSEPNPATIGVPKIGVLAVINTTRLGRNFLQCAVNVGGASAQADSNQIQPCGGQGSFQVSGESLEYVFGATTPELCNIFQSQMPLGTK